MAPRRRQQSEGIDELDRTSARDEEVIGRADEDDLEELDDLDVDDSNEHSTDEER